MKQLLHAGLILSMSLCAKPTKAQTALPYATGFDNTAQQAGWQLFRKGVTGSSRPYWVYATMMPFSAPNYLSHNYPVGGTDVTDNWFVSPMFHLDAGGKIDSVRHAFSGFGKPGAGDTVAIYLLVGNADPALATSRILLHDFRDTRYLNDGTWYQTSSIPIPATSGHCYIAFRYHTVVNWLDVKFDNLSVSGAATGIDETGNSPVRVSCYPNPASDRLYFRPDAGIKEISVSDISGKELISRDFAPSIDISSLAPGTYLLRSVLYSGLVTAEVLIKK